MATATAVPNPTSPETKDIPRLSLSLETPPSSSPFPSPSSSFLPPPMPHAHEFAKTLHQNRLPKDRKKSTDQGELASATIPSVSVPAPFSQSHSGEMLGRTASSALAASEESITPGVDPKTPTQSSRLSAPVQVPISTARESLVSTRPAPPSPAVSRRASTALSAKASSRPTSTMLSRSPRPPSDALGTASSAFIPPTKPPRRRAPIVIVRDFGFSADDERYEGHGAHVPKPNRRLAKRNSTMSTVSLSSIEDEERSGFDDDNDDGAANGWGSWGLSFRAWATEGPSQDDLNLGFTGGDEDEDSSDAYADDYDDDYYNDYTGIGGEQTAIIPGIYRAIYAFEPEGMAEMRLEEDQSVHIIGRGGGVGWAVAIRPAAEGGGHALVPESYLELVTPTEGSNTMVVENAGHSIFVDDMSKKTPTPTLDVGRTVETNSDTKA